MLIHAVKFRWERGGSTYFARPGRRRAEVLGIPERRRRPASTNGVKAVQTTPSTMEARLCLPCKVGLPLISDEEGAITIGSRQSSSERSSSPVINDSWPGRWRLFAVSIMVCFSP